MVRERGPTLIFDPNSLRRGPSEPLGSGPARMTIRVPCAVELEKEDPRQLSKKRMLLGRLVHAMLAKAQDLMVGVPDSIRDEATQALNIWRTSQEGCWGCPIHQFSATREIVRPCGGMHDTHNAQCIRDAYQDCVYVMFQGRAQYGAGKIWNAIPQAPPLYTAHCVRPDDFDE